MIARRDDTLVPGVHFEDETLEKLDWRAEDVKVPDEEAERIKKEYNL